MLPAWRSLLRHTPHLPSLMVWALVACAGCSWLVLNRLQQLHAAFETDARIVHRLLSQRVVQHDAILATLALLQPTAPDQGGAAELELGSLKLQADAVVVLQLHQPELGLVGKGVKGEQQEQCGSGHSKQAHGQPSEEV